MTVIQTGGSKNNGEDGNIQDYRRQKKNVGVRVSVKKAIIVYNRDKCVEKLTDVDITVETFAATHFIILIIFFVFCFFFSAMSLQDVACRRS